VNATDSVQLIGTSADGRASSLLGAQTGSRGKAGNLSIDTRNLIVRDGAQVSSGTFGEGAGGNLTVNATGSVQLIGESVNGQFVSGLFSRTVNRGKAGDLSIETGNLIVRDGAQVSSGTRGEGAGGNLTVNATNSIQVIGRTADGQFPSLLTATTTASGNAGDLLLKTRQFIIEDGGQVSSQQTTATATGNVGNINIEVQVLAVRNNASITVEDRSTRVDGQGTEPIGNINIQTESFTIDRGIISAETASTNGGNIALDVQDLLLLRNGSLISTNAGTVGAGGNGGNITFNGNFIVAVPKENSDITANAFTGQGGRVEINAQSVFGIQARPQLTPLSDITASSERGIAGVVSINTPDVDPNRGLVQIPVDVTDASGLIVQTCPTGNTTANQSNEFVITGRGGLPPTPSEAVNRDAIQVDLVTTNAEEQPSISPNQPDQTSSPRTTPATRLTHAPLVEAQSWQLGADGRVVLVAAAPQSAIAPSSNRSVYCP
jgi:large exoprotein involved in heme utilization and adhesion